MGIIGTTGEMIEAGLGFTIEKSAGVLTGVVDAALVGLNDPLKPVNEQNPLHVAGEAAKNIGHQIVIMSGHGNID